MQLQKQKEQKEPGQATLFRWRHVHWWLDREPAEAFYKECLKQGLFAYLHGASGPGDRGALWGVGHMTYSCYGVARTDRPLPPTEKDVSELSDEEVIKRLRHHVPKLVVELWNEIRNLKERVEKLEATQASGSGGGR